MGIKDMRSVWTAFILLVFAGMLALVFQFGLGTMALAIMLTTIMVFIKLIRRGAFNLRKSRAHETQKLD